MSDHESQQNVTFHEEDLNSTPIGSERAEGFNSATLQLGVDTSSEPRVEFHEGGRMVKPDVPSSISFTKKAKVVASDITARRFFSKRAGIFEQAVEQLKTQLKEILDGEVLGAWLITEIDHWDHDHERMVLLCEHSLVIARYDFVAVKPLDLRRILLYMIDTVIIGDIIYPEKSVMPVREHGAVRVSWGRNRTLSFSQKWNPWCSEIPYTTFSHHPLLYHPSDTSVTQYNVDAFYEALASAVRKAHLRKKQDISQLTIERGPIHVETYASLSSMIFNQSHLGYSLERGGISF